MTEEVNSDRAKQIRVRVEKNLLNVIKSQAKECQMSLSGYMNLTLNLFLKKQEVSFEETLTRIEKKEVESRVFFTISEAELLKKYAQINDWSISKELRYRVISTLSKKPKLSGEELKAVHSVRFSINVLGTNINRLIRNNEVLSEDNMSICRELLDLIKDLVKKINYLEKCSNTYFKLK